MRKFFKKFFSIEVETPNPGKHGSTTQVQRVQYTLSELERRLNAEINGYGYTILMWPYNTEENEYLT